MENAARCRILRITVSAEKVFGQIFTLYLGRQRCIKAYVQT
jgi:hypothetical protein